MGIWGLVLGCLAGSAILLVLLPRSLAYDPWSWLIWGREIVHLDLDTRQAATAVKPLPILADALFALTGSAAAPVLWLLVARAAGLLAIALAFRLGRRLGGVGAGLIAAAVLALSDEYLGYLFMRGMSEPFAAAAVLAAVDSHLDGRRRTTVGWLVIAGLLRPEAWPFLFCYCVWLAMRGPLWRRAGVVAIGVVVPASWFLIDLAGSGKLSSSAEAAKHTSQGGPLLHHYPGLATFRETWHLMSGPVVVLFLAGLAWAGYCGVRDRRLNPTLWLSAGALAWAVIDAALAQGRFATGAPRYLLPGVALAGVAIGVSVVHAAAAMRRVSTWRGAAWTAGTVTTVALVLLALPRIDKTRQQVDEGVRIERNFAHLQTSLTHAVALAGGRTVVLRCGAVTTDPFQVPLVAWTLHVHVGAVGIVVQKSGTAFQQVGAPSLQAAADAGYQSLGTVGPSQGQWTVMSSCPAAATG